MDGPLLKDFAKHSLKWKLIVRLARIWEYRSVDGNELYGLIFVIVDCRCGTLEGLIGLDKMPRFKEKFEEGIKDKFEEGDVCSRCNSLSAYKQVCQCSQIIFSWEKFTFSMERPMAISEPIRTFSSTTLEQFSLHPIGSWQRTAKLSSRDATDIICIASVISLL